MNGAGVEERAGWGSESPCCPILGGEKGDWEDAAEGGGGRGGNGIRTQVERQSLYSISFELYMYRYLS